MELDANKDTTATWSRERGIGLCIALGPLLVFAIIELCSNVTLISAIPFWLYCVAVICGAAYSYVAIEQIQVTTAKSKPPTWFQIISVTGIYSLGIVPYLVRNMILFLAFVFLNPPTVSEIYVIDGAGSGRRARADKIFVRPVEFDGRRISVFADYDLESSYRHVSTHGKDCIRLATQTGRGGVRRVQTPSIIDYLNDERLLSRGEVIKGCRNSGDTTALLNAMRQVR